MSESAKCQLCGEPMPPGEETFNYHGFSGPCPKPPALTQPGAELPDVQNLRRVWQAHVEATDKCNAAIPPVTATNAERELYKERYRAKGDAEREWISTAIRFAQSAATLPGVVQAAQDAERADLRQKLEAAEQRAEKAVKLREEWTLALGAWKLTNEGRQAMRATQLMLEADQKRIAADERAEKAERELGDLSHGYDVIRDDLATLRQQLADVTAERDSNIAWNPVARSMLSGGAAMREVAKQAFDTINSCMVPATQPLTKSERTLCDASVILRSAISTTAGTVLLAENQRLREACRDAKNEASICKICTAEEHAAACERVRDICDAALSPRRRADPMTTTPEVLAAAERLIEGIELGDPADIGDIAYMRKSGASFSLKDIYQVANLADTLLDGEPVTEEWLSQTFGPHLSSGCGKRYSLHFATRRGLQLTWCPQCGTLPPCICIETLAVIESPTRGQLRQLAVALGITLQEPANA